METLSVSVWPLGAAPSQPLDFSQLGIAAIVCVLLSIGIWTLWRAYLAKDRKIEELQLARVQDFQQYQTALVAAAQAATTREREVADRYVPLLADTAAALRQAPERFDKVLADVGQAVSQRDIERLVERLEIALRGAGR